jgi:hypothetical protein
MGERSHLIPMRKIITGKSGGFLSQQIDILFQTGSHPNIGILVISPGMYKITPRSFISGNNATNAFQFRRLLRPCHRVLGE